jgi:hypothetical protein
LVVKPWKTQKKLVGHAPILGGQTLENADELAGHAPILGQQTLENADELAGHAPILGLQTLENADSNSFQFQFLNSNSIVSLGK